LNVIKSRHSTRTSFNSNRKIRRTDLAAVIEAARWSPTAHNMQNFEIIIVDDPNILKAIGNLRSRISEEFLRENYDQLSFSKKELQRKKVGILGSHFPRAWRDPTKLHDVAVHSPAVPLRETIQDAPVVLIVIYDPRKRAPASPGDFLGIMSLGCVMENMWLVAQSRHISFQVMSVFGSPQVEAELRRILNFPRHTKIAYAIRLGYVRGGFSVDYLRVRREPAAIAHYNRY